MSRMTMYTTALAVLVFASSISAQSRSGSSGSSRGGSSSGFGSSSGSGSNGFGGGADVSAGFGSNTQGGFGDTSSFGQSSGMNALSSGRSGAAAGLGRSSSSSSGSSSSSRSGSLSGSGNNRNSNSRNSSGRNSVTGMTGQRSGGRNMGMNGMSGMNGMNNNMGRNGRLSSRGIGVQQAVRPVIQLSLDAMPNIEPTVIAQAATTNLATNKLMPNLQGVQVNMDASGIATVRGTAANSREATMAAAMLSLEPGVRSVKNEITVTPASSTPAFGTPASR